MVRVWKSVFAGLLLTWGAGLHAQAAPSKPPLPVEVPMTFYVAKGAPNSCGPGCSEWIAAEGDFGIGSSTQLRALLARLGKQKLPVFFYSPGGLIGESVKVGRLIREKGLTAGVARTIPDGCSDRKKVKECGELKRSGKKVDAELLTSAGRCNSACVYAVLGGKTRVVPPGARLGVHAARSVSIANKRVKVVDLAKVPAQQQKADRLRFRQTLRTYVREMGIDLRLVDTAEDVPHEKVHYLTRNQIAEFGIDRSTFSETPWKFVEGPAVSKYFMQARGRGKREFPASYIRLACGSHNDVRLIYSRGLTADESTAWQIKFLIGDEGLPVSSAGVHQYDWIENGRSFNVHLANADFSHLETLSGDVLEIVETSWGKPAPYAHIVRLSSEGWGEAIGKLREKCLNR